MRNESICVKVCCHCCLSAGLSKDTGQARKTPRCNIYSAYILSLYARSLTMALQDCLLSSHALMHVRTYMMYTCSYSIYLVPIQVSKVIYIAINTHRTGNTADIAYSSWKKEQLVSRSTPVSSIERSLEGHLQMFVAL